MELARSHKVQEVAVGISMRIVVAVAAVVLTIGAASATAQPLNTPRGIGSPPPPTASPYLNLLRGGASPAFNNQSLVRPQLYYQGALQSLQAQAAAQTPMIQTPGEGSELPGTGMPVQFMNHRGYFLNAGAGFGGAGPAMNAGAAGAARPAGNTPSTAGRAPSALGR
jgi:hypothetical protein